jgi:subtilisin family serine protease
VEPFAVADPQATSAAGTTWGAKAIGADTSPFTGQGIVVAILDTGIDKTHPAFSGVEIVEKDFTGEGNGDEDGHGTHCAGTIFGREVSGTRIGIAPGVKKALIGKVLGRDGGSSTNVVKAIQWAVDEGAHIISMSLGIDFPGLVKTLEQRGFPTELATSRALEGYRANLQLFDRLTAFVRAAGSFTSAAIFIAAAGNESRKDEDPNFEIAVSPPAVAEGIISVAALGEGEHGFVVAPFSNTGALVSGPGVRILSAKAGGGLAALSGTSMAAPHVAGAAALWGEKIRQTRTLNSIQLTAKLIGSAGTEKLEPGFDVFDVGAGMVRAPQE